ncbi:ATP-binding protein [Helicobacter pametensis]|uniref:ATP-binding protein n=1 Tax=Helicobacter pametensis TaxID=95149 RepID=UPI000481CDDA|nr:ATP-binding protein [Helicobacter pametensis]
MKISQVKIKNFRSYKDETIIDFNNLTAFVGKNDIGKSTILEALDIFFEGGIIKIDPNDVNKECELSGDREIQIAVAFEDCPQDLILDTSNPTSLKEEYLLNKEGKFEIVKRYPSQSSKSKTNVFIRANYPTNEKCGDLHSLKITDLRKIAKENGIECSNLAKSAEIRKAIWNHYSQDLQLQEIEIDVSKEDAKSIWEQIEKELPCYALFQSDRSNSDKDDEVQNPLKSAVSQIFKSDKISDQLTKIASEVIKKLDEITTLTLEKLKDMNPEIATTLKPKLPKVEELKWQDVFKNVSISGDEDIPINKRGSGVRRLILLNFFRAEAERIKKEQKKSSIIYAIEEPETSQHQEHQRKLIEAFKELANQAGIQIILTTHSPSIVKLLKFDNLRVVKNGGSKKEIVGIEESALPIPSLNEVNYLAFGEADEEYHNELYGYIESRGNLSNYIQGKLKRNYIKAQKNGGTKAETITTTEYIRHQIHHPENTHNIKFTPQELQQSIQDMRAFIIANP